MEQKRDKIYIEVLRIIAAYLVIFNHTNEKGMGLFTVRQSSRLFLFYEMFSILIRTAVPIFLTISGGLLISREETIGGYCIGY